MNIFISWHGKRSRAVAAALHDWLQRVVQAIKPFYSPEIERGANWGNEIDKALEGTRYGICCLTPENLDSKWIHYEAGALSKTGDALIWTYLLDLTPPDVRPPLAKFQHTVAEKRETWELLRTINACLAEVGEEPLKEEILNDQFESCWPKLETALKQAQAIPLASSSKTGPEVETLRDERDILNEILELIRNQERRLSGPDPSTQSRQLLPRKKNSSDELRVSLPPEWLDRSIRDFAIQLAVLIDALEWMIDRSEKTQKKALRLLFNNTWSAGEIDDRIKAAASGVHQHEPLEWDLVRPSPGQRFELKV